MKPQLLFPPPLSAGVASRLDEAWRLEEFASPFAFSAFFSPEDTLLCVCAADAAYALLSDEQRAETRPNSSFRFVELTSGSGLVGFYMLRRAPGTILLGLDIDPEAIRVSEANARLLGLSARAQFRQSDLWAAGTKQLLEVERPDVLICNPPYVPEPPGTAMQIEAGAGPNGTAHLLRALELTRLLQPSALALSWCSLSDPVGIVAAAEANGYELDTLFVTAIGDGEYSGSVHPYLRNLADCYINEQRETLDIIASDGSARFAYLLFAGAFRRRNSDAKDRIAAVERICRDFVRDGVGTLASARAPFSLNCSILNRWDELRLRILLHGPVRRPATRLA